MDRILIRDLTARCIIGFRPGERDAKQDVVVSIALSTDLSRAGKSDLVGDSVDYREVKKRVLALMEQSQFNLIEALAEAIASTCLETPGIEEVSVTVDKPGALRFARSVAVEIRRRKAIRAFVGIGSNIEPEENIKDALRLLAHQVRVVALSTFYRAPAEGAPGQPDYVNGVVAIETDLPLDELKHGVLRAIEHRLGRRRTIDKFASRSIDLDILLYGSLRVQRADIQLPSEDIEKRSFVAIPLAEIAPDLTLPGMRLCVRDLAERFDRSQMTPIALADDLRREFVASGCVNECRQSQAAHL